MTCITMPTIFNSSLYNELQVVPDKLLAQYILDIKEIRGKLKNKFPLLHLSILPTNVMREAFIYGNLIPAKNLLEFGEDIVIENNIALPIFAIIKVDYQTKGIKVYDCCRRIQWSHIEPEIRHCMRGDNGLICTHHESDMKGDNGVFEVLESAWRLFIEYCKYDRVGKFDLKCHEHGFRGNYGK